MHRRNHRSRMKRSVASGRAPTSTATATRSSTSWRRRPAASATGGRASGRTTGASSAAALRTSSPTTSSPGRQPRPARPRSTQSGRAAQTRTAAQGPPETPRLLATVAGGDAGSQQSNSGGSQAGRGASDGGICEPGATRGCIGPGACEGSQACLSDGSGWGVCDCGGGTGGSGGGGGGTTGGSSGAAGESGGTSGGSSGASGASGWLKATASPIQASRSPVGSVLLAACSLGCTM